MNTVNWTRTTILFKLRERGVNAASLASENGLSRSTFYSGMERPYPRVQRIIADALEERIQDIWPQFYDPRGHRIGVSRRIARRAA